MRGDPTGGHSRLVKREVMTDRCHISALAARSDRSFFYAWRFI
jgi:hypothetical protein